MQQLTAVMNHALRDCIKGESLLYTVLATGLQEPYTNLKPPIDDISFVRPIIGVLYLIIAGFFFMAAVDRRKKLVFGLVLLAALLATIANVAALMAYFRWMEEGSSCQKTVVEAGLNRVAESALKKTAQDLQAHLQAQPKTKEDVWDISIGAEGRTLSWIHRAKGPIVDMDGFHRFVSEMQKDLFKGRCSEDDSFFISIRAIETHTFYSDQGERLTSFSIDRADCPKW
jgi:hypothetical protein